MKGNKLYIDALHINKMEKQDTKTTLPPITFRTQVSQAYVLCDHLDITGKNLIIRPMLKDMSMIKIVKHEFTQYLP